MPPGGISCDAHAAVVAGGLGRGGVERRQAAVDLLAMLPSLDMTTEGLPGSAEQVQPGVYAYLSSEYGSCRNRTVTMGG